MGPGVVFDSGGWKFGKIFGSFWTLKSIFYSREKHILQVCCEKQSVMFSGRYTINGSFVCSFFKLDITEELKLEENNPDYWEKLLGTKHQFYLWSCYLGGGYLFFPLFLIYFLIFIFLHWDTIQKSIGVSAFSLTHSCQENCYIIQHSSYLLWLLWLKVLKQWTVRLNSTFEKHLFLSSKQEEREAETNSLEALCLGSAVVLDNIL